MPKNPATISVRLLGYQRDRLRRRRSILSSVLRGQRENGVRYNRDARFELVVLLYFKKGKRHDIHDGDNRLKDIRDALQGRFGSSRSSRFRRPSSTTRVDAS